MPADTSQPIRVLIVEDSLATRQLLAQILRSDPAIEVVGMAGDGAEAMQLLARVKADIVTVDIRMPRMCGFELTRRIMESGRPVPVIIMSASWDPDEVATTFRAVEAGAVAVVNKPHGPSHAEHESGARKLLQTIKTMSEVKVVRRWLRPAASETRHASVKPAPDTGVSRLKVRLIAIGASTGGPVILQTILSRIPRECDVPILIVQHIAVGFLPGLSEWLATTTGFPVHVASHEACALPGHAYLAPDGLHMGIRPDGHIVLEAGEADTNLCPSVAHLFSSVATAFGANAAGVLLSGMGRDGAEELKLMRQRGALTIAQDRGSCVVFGMPGEAVRLGGASYVLAPEKIAALLASVTWRDNESKTMSNSIAPIEILIVEDSRTQAELLMHLLESQGYCVIVATNGEEGLAAARKHLPALIVSDVEMPLMTGYQMCRALKDDVVLSRIPVILLTSLSDPADVLRGLKAGADYYLTKPCDRQFLLERVAAVLESPSAIERSDGACETIEMTLQGERYAFTADSRQILNLLLSTYANAVQRNRELAGAERRLSEQNKLLQESAQAERRAHEALKTAQAHLVQSEKLASLGQLVAGVAHEINNPLAFVTNNVSVLQRDFVALRDLVQLFTQAAPQIDPASDLIAPIHELCERIDLPYTLANLAEVLDRSREGLRRIGRIVADLRDFARLDESDLKAVDLNAGIRTTANIMMTKAREKQVRMEVDLGEMPMVTCFSAKINQVVLNLLDNAIDACSSGGKVTIQTAASGDTARIDVTDTGSGIDPAIQSRIFDPFFTTKPVGKGTGLGLSISYGIVNDHNGTIEVDSCPGRGSHFIVQVPIHGPLAA